MEGETPHATGEERGGEREREGRLALGGEEKTQERGEMKNLKNIN